MDWPDESSVVVMVPWSVAVLRGRPYKSRMTHHASLVVTQILGEHQYTEAQTQQDQHHRWKNRKWQDTSGAIPFETSESSRG